MADDESDLQTRRKRALLVAGAIGLAAIAWNADDWFDGDVVRVESSDREEVREALREARDEIREGVREARDEAREARDEAQSARGDEDLPRISEENGVLRIEGPDGRTVTISTDSDAAEEPAEEEATAESNG